MTAHRIHSVVIVPDFGHSPDGYSRGPEIGRFCGLDVVDAYLETICEELDNDGMRYSVMPTRDRLGPSADRILEMIEPLSLVLHLSAGFTANASSKEKNMTSIFYGGGGAKDLAEELSEASADWGQCYIWGHKTANPKLLKDDPILNVPQTRGIRIVPFDLNGPDIEQYAARLPQLGVAIGRVVSGYLLNRGQARARHTIGLGG